MSGLAAVRGVAARVRLAPPIVGPGLAFIDRLQAFDRRMTGGLLGCRRPRLTEGIEGGNHDVVPASRRAARGAPEHAGRPGADEGAQGAVNVGAYALGTAATNLFQGRSLTEGLTGQDAAISFGAGFVTGATGGANVVLRVAIGFGAGSVSSYASQQWNGRRFDPGEIFLGGGFGALGSALDFGAGMIGAFRGVVAGGGLTALQNWFNERRGAALSRPLLTAPPDCADPAPQGDLISLANSSMEPTCSSSALYMISAISERGASIRDSVSTHRPVELTSL